MIARQCKGTRELRLYRRGRNLSLSALEPMRQPPSKLFPRPILHKDARELKSIRRCSNDALYGRAGTSESGITNEGDRLRRVILLCAVRISETRYGAAHDIFKTVLALPNFIP